MLWWNKSISIEGREIKIKMKLKKQRAKSKEKKGNEIDDEWMEVVNEFWDNQQTYYEEEQKKLIEQNRINRETFNDLDDQTKLEVEGVTENRYVRILFNNMSVNVITSFNPKNIYIIRGLLKSEEILTNIQVMVLIHRYCPKVIKSKETIIVSNGWREDIKQLLYIFIWRHKK